MSEKFEANFRMTIPEDLAKNINVEKPGETESFYEFTPGYFLHTFIDETFILIQPKEDFVLIGSNKRFKVMLDSGYEGNYQISWS